LPIYVSHTGSMQNYATELRGSGLNYRFSNDGQYDVTAHVTYRHHIAGTITGTNKVTSTIKFTP
jgi:hypothetical protein